MTTGPLAFKNAALGIVDCPICGWQHATVRKNKRGMAWSHCERWRCQCMTREKPASDQMLAGMRPITEAPQPAERIEDGPPAAPAPVPPPEEQAMPAAKKPAGKKQTTKPPRRTGPAAHKEDDDDAKPAKGSSTREKRRDDDDEDDDISSLFE